MHLMFGCNYPIFYGEVESTLISVPTLLPAGGGSLGSLRSSFSSEGAETTMTKRTTCLSVQTSASFSVSGTRFNLQGVFDV